MARETFANGTPKVDLDAWRLSDYADEMRKKYVKDQEALFRETKENCTKYTCPYGAIGGIFVRMFDAVLNMALEVIYSSLSALTDLFYSTVGVAARIADELIIVACYMMSWSTAGKTCCKKSVIINAIIKFIQSVSDAIADLFKMAIQIYYKFMGILEKFFYKCRCERIEDEMQEEYKEELDMAKAEFPEYTNYKAVFNMPKNKEDGTYYLIVKPHPETFSDNFKRHVSATCEMFSKWPYGTGDCPKAWVSNSLTIWKSYVNILINYWLSTTNLRSKANANGYSHEQRNAMIDYCKSAMPKPLFNYVLEQLSDTEAKLKKEGIEP